MTRRAAAYVHVAGRWFAPGDVVPAEYADQIRNPAVWGEDEVPLEPGKPRGWAKGGPAKDRDPEVAPVPPRSGAGSGKDAWAAYAEANDVLVPDGAGRDDIVALLEEAGVPTSQEG